MFSMLQKLAKLIGAAHLKRLGELAHPVSRSPRVVLILLALLIAARSSPPGLDGRAAAMTRKALLKWLAGFNMCVSREALRKLLDTLFVARLVDLKGSRVCVSRALLDDLDSLGPPAAAQTPSPSGANPALAADCAPGALPTTTGENLSGPALVDFLEFLNLLQHELKC